MIHIISPAKSLDFTSEVYTTEFTIPFSLDQSEKLINKLRRTSAKQIKEMMSISDALVKLNKDRYDSWRGETILSENSRQALFAFAGDVYLGLDAKSLTTDNIEYSQKNLRILSGLYGVLKPLDTIEPYRLEMGSSLKIGRKKNLYDFWGNELGKQLNEEMQNAEEPVLVNLASNEYFKAVDKKEINGRIISPQFKDAKKGQYKIISFFAKKARGLMSRYIIENKVEKATDLLGFNYSGYKYNPEMSSADSPVFTREENL
jgi:cytoplasmic iron level regulating protein YaaA (DUF328/UPF0246 family)